MTKNEAIYNALGIIEGAVCVSQKNTREALMKAIEMIKDAIEENVACENNNDEVRKVCEHDFILKNREFIAKYGMYEFTYECSKCGKRKVDLYE